MSPGPDGTPSGVGDRRAAAVVAAGVFLVYLVTLHPGLPGGDAGELISAAYTLGIAHPPGYPLFCVLGKLFSFLPVDSIGWRINLLSAVCDAGAAGFLAWTVIRWTGHQPAGVVAGCLYAFSPGIWRYATTAEVFPLNNLLVAIFLAVLLELVLSRRLVLAYLASFVIGLGLANQHAFALLALPISVAMIARREELRSSRVIMLCILALLAGLSPYIYLPIAARSPGPISWGDPTTWSGFFEHLLRKHVGTFALAAPRPDGQIPFLMELWYYFVHLPAEVLGPLVLVAIVGLRWSMAHRESGVLPAALLGAYVFYLVFFHSLANLPLTSSLFWGIQARFWQEPNYLVFLWLGLGLAQIWPRNALVSMVGALSLIGLQLGLHWKVCDQHQNRYLEQYARALLGKLPPDAILLAEGDLNIFSTYYVQFCEGYREDVLVLDLATLSYGWRKPWVMRRRPDLIVPGTHYSPVSAGTGFSLAPFLEANLKRYPIFSYAAIYAVEPGLAQRYTGGEPGVLEPIRPREPVSFEESLAQRMLHLFEFPLPPADVLDDTTWESLLREQYGYPRYAIAVALLGRAATTGSQEELVAGISLLEDVVERWPGCPPAYIKHLALAYTSLSRVQAGHSGRILALWERYIAAHPTDDPDLPAIMARVPQLVR